VRAPGPGPVVGGHLQRDGQTRCGPCSLTTILHSESAGPTACTLSGVWAAFVKNHIKEWTRPMRRQPIRQICGISSVLSHDPARFLMGGLVTDARHPSRAGLYPGTWPLPLSIHGMAAALTNPQQQPMMAVDANGIPVAAVAPAAGGTTGGRKRSAEGPVVRSESGLNLATMFDLALPQGRSPLQLIIYHNCDVILHVALLTIMATRV